MAYIDKDTERIIAKEKADKEINEFDKRQDKLIKRGKVLFWILTVWGIFVGVMTILLGAVQISTVMQESVVAQVNYVGYLVLLLGVCFIVVAYLLIKGVEFARLIYSILMGAEGLLALGLIMTGQEAVIAFAEVVAIVWVLAGLLIVACAILPTSKAIKEYMYQREILAINSTVVDKSKSE